MELQFSPVILLFVLSAAATATLAIVSWHRWKSPIAPYFTLLFAAATLWNLGDAGEFLSVSSTAKFLFVCVEYPGMVTVPVAWFLIVLYYTGNSRYLSKKTISLFFLIPSVTVAFVLTNPLHHLYYTNIVTVLEQGTVVGVYLHGPLFWIFICYSYALAVVGLVLVISRLSATYAIYRYQMAILLVACTIPFVANIVYVAGWGPFPHVDFAPLLFSLSGLIAAYGITRYQLLSLMPVAYSRVFHTIADGVIVVDDREDIVDLNPAAERILGSVPGRLIAQPAKRVLPPEVRFPISGEKKDQASPQEIAIGTSARLQYYEATCIPFDPGIPGRTWYYLVVLRDITRRKQAESAFTDASRKLALMTNITRHDILNHITALDCYIELASTATSTQEMEEYYAKEHEIIAKIREQIEFTREYQNLGVEAAQWQDVSAVIARAVAQSDPGKIAIRNEVPVVEVFADPMLEKVFSNLISNAINYGKTITRITFTGEVSGEGFRIVCEDDGIGIRDEDKPRLFIRGFGKHTGLGLFLSREIVSITGLTIMETGKPGSGARFEILVPPEAWRFRPVENQPA